jgi:hypothetical protein
MVSGEIGYSASRPDNSKEMYQLAGGKISSLVQPVDLCYFSFSFNHVFFPNIVNK